MSTTTTEDRPRNVIDAIAAVMHAMPGIGKGERSEQGYNYRGIEAITKEAQPLFGQYTVVFVPRIVSREVKEFTINNKPWTEDHLEVVYTVYGPGGIDDHIEIGPLHGLGRDNSDKGVNKALTQAYKYALIQTLCIGDAKDDADREPAREADGKTQAAEEFPEHTPDELARQAGWMDLEHAETTRALSRRLLGERINAGQITREEGNAAWGDYGTAPSYEHYTAWAEKWLLAQTSAVGGGDHPSPPTTAGDVPTPAGSQNRAGDEAGAGPVARDGGSPAAVAATPDAPDLMGALEASLERAKEDRRAAAKGAQEEDSDPKDDGSAGNVLPMQSAMSPVTSTGPPPDEGSEAIPKGFLSFEFARRSLAGHATTRGNPLAQTQAGSFEVADLALRRLPVGPVSHEEMDKLRKAVEPLKPGDPDPLEAASALVEKAKGLEDKSRRTRPAPRQMGLVEN